MVSEESSIKEQVDAYVGREFHNFEDIMKLPPCILEDAVGVQWVKTSSAAPQSFSRKLDQQNTVKEKPFRVTHLLELHEVPAAKGDAPELTLTAARRFTFNIRSSLSGGHVSLLTVESPYGKWWQATLESSLHSSLHLSGEDTEPWQYSGRPSQFATAKEALAAAWATPEIKGLA